MITGHDFTQKYGKFAVAILLLIGLYRIADVVMGVVANVFYLEKGFDITQKFILRIWILLKDQSV